MTKASLGAKRTKEAVCLCVLVCGLLWGGVARAQDGSGDGAGEEEEIELKVPAPRQGYYVSGVLSGFVNLNSSDEDDVDPMYGVYGGLRLGEMVNDWLGFGLQIGGGGGSGGDRWSMGFGGLMLDTQVVPIQSEGWNHLSVRFGVGAGGLSATDAESKDDELKGTGGAYYAFTAAYDIFPFYEKGSGGFAITPMFQTQLLPGELWSAYIMTLGVEFTWWSGLNKNRLELPVDEAFTKEKD